MAYTVRLHEHAIEDLARLPQKVQRQIIKKLRALEGNPRPTIACRLRGEGNEGLWRTKSGPYRIIYSIEEGVLLVHVIRIGDRKNIYRGF